MVLLGGDEKAVALLCDALPERLAPLVTTIDASRAMESTGERGERGAEPAHGGPDGGIGAVLRWPA